MSAIGVEGIREYRGMGESWPKAIRSSWEPKAWRGVRWLCNLAYDLDHAGEHLLGMCGCKD